MFILYDESKRIMWHHCSLRLLTPYVYFCSYIERLKFLWQMMMTKLSPEEYILATINLYLDIINLFLELLRIFGDRKWAATRRVGCTGHEKVHRSGAGAQVMSRCTGHGQVHRSWADAQGIGRCTGHGQVQWSWADAQIASRCLGDGLWREKYY